MQIFALDEKKRVISALVATRKTLYFCQECGEKVKLKKGIYRRPHFSHISLTSCKLKKKSCEHIALQSFLEKKVGSTSEVPFPHIKRVADCVWEKEKIIFEIQCSSISREEVAKRIKDYSSQGYRLVWILHDKTFNKKKKSRAELTLQKYPHYYTNMDAFQKGEIYDQFENTRRSIEISKPLTPLSYKTGVARLRKKWPLRFENDLFETPLYKKRGRFTLKNLFKGIASLLLEFQ